MIKCLYLSVIIRHILIPNLSRSKIFVLRSFRSLSINEIWTFQNPTHTTEENVVENQDEDSEYEDVGITEILLPAVGMEFDLIEYVYQFYKDYGLRYDFEIVKRSNHKKEACYHYDLACNKHKKPIDMDCDLPFLP
jgi:hypothetical protein